MHFVSATSVNELDAIRLAEKYGEDFVSAHGDGSVVQRNDHGDIRKVWLNPGQSVSALTVFDNILLVAYDDNCVRVFSVETGMLLRELVLPFDCHGFAVFEHLIVCIPKNRTEFCIMHRESLEIISSIDTASFVVDVLSILDKIFVVCSAHIYVLEVSLKSYTPSFSLVFTPSFTIVAAALHNGFLVLASPDELRLLKINTTCEFHEDFSIPTSEIPICAKQIGVGVLVQCDKRTYIFLRDNNVQVVSSPFTNQRSTELVTSYGLVGGSPEIWYSYELQKNELVFVQQKTKLELTTKKYLMGQTDPSVTAIMGEYVGNERGEINGIKALPSEILSIEGNMAHSNHGSIKLPLQPLNVVYKNTRGGTHTLHGKLEAHGSNSSFKDSRISIPTEIKLELTKISTEWVGISYQNYVCLQLNDATQPQIAVLQILSKIIDDETAEKSLNHSENSLLDLESLVISSCENRSETPLLYETAGRLLAKLWNQKRVLNLMQYNGHRSLKLLAAMSNFCKIDTRAIKKYIEKQNLFYMVEASGREISVQDCLAVLWVFINVPEVVKSVQIPFNCFQLIPEPAITKFSFKIAENNSEKLLDSAENELEMLKKHNGSYLVSVVYAIKLLLAAVTSTHFPASESQLVRLVKIVMPTINNRITGAKQILTRLVATNQVYYHRGRQKLLIPTPRTPGQVAQVIDVTNEEQQILKSVDDSKQDIQPVFSGDGKMVMAAVGRRRYGWHLTRALLPFFRSGDVVQPVELD